MSTGITITPETLIVSPTLTEQRNFLSIRVEDGPTVAIVTPKDGHPNYGDAAIMAVSNKMFDLLVELQRDLVSNSDVINMTSYAERISVIFEKIAAEAGA